MKGVLIVVVDKEADDDLYILSVSGKLLREVCTSCKLFELITTGMLFDVNTTGVLFELITTGVLSKIIATGMPSEISGFVVLCTGENV